MAIRFRPLYGTLLHWAKAKKKLIIIAAPQYTHGIEFSSESFWKRLSFALAQVYMNL